MGCSELGMPVSSYSFFHTLSQIYYKKNNPDLFDKLHPREQRKINEMKKLTDRVLEPYNLFAFIVHDPEKHREFSENLKKQFLKFHNKTGKKLLFFALTQPPGEWKDEEVQPEYFKHLQQVFREDRNLAAYPRQIETNLFNQSFNVHAIANTLKIPSDQLPAIVITTHPSLWSFQWYRTCTKQIGNQLKELAIFANDLDQYRKPETLPRVFQNKMFELLQEEYDEEINLCEGKGNEFLTESLATALSELLSFLINRESQFSDYTEMAKSQVNIAMTRVINAIKAVKSNGTLDEEQEELMDTLCEKVGTFITLLQPTRENVIQDFDIDSNQLLKIGLSVGDFLKSNQNRFPNLDYTPAAICLAKAYEIEINKSIVHWIRKKNDITLPEYYCQVQPEVEAVIIPKDVKEPQPIDFNKSRKNGTWHPPAMGQSYLVASKNLEKQEWSHFWRPEERKMLLREWQKIADIRNHAAHSEKVTDEDMNLLLDSINTLDAHKIFGKLAGMRDSFRMEETNK
jgi:hypothetical protein